MTWSFSKGRIFKQCPRKWFFSTIYADARSTDPLRHEAYLLSKLQSLYAWRGQIVDAALGNLVVADLNANRSPTLSDALKYARRLFEMQKDFGLKHRIRDPGISITDVGPSFAAFSKIEEGESISPEDFARAWNDIETAIRNVWKLNELRERVRAGTYRVAQRTLQFQHCGANVRAVPDLIVFFSNRSPVIVDWKVHTFGTRDYADQLATYSLALTRTAPHNDFPMLAARCRPHEIELIEAQLLLGSARVHTLNEDDIHRTEERIAEGIVTLQLAYDGKPSSELQPEDFPTARNPNTCQRCPFRKICWN
jgi:PD-(D/E)XK nuclease superfamily